MSNQALHFDLISEFEQRLREISQEAQELGYPNAAFREMLEEYGGRDTARKLMLSGDIQSGFQAIVKAGRPDLTVESVVGEPRFRTLFSVAERAAAKWRLQLVTKSD